MKIKIVNCSTKPLKRKPSSGMAIKKGFTLLNTPGTLDADFRGAIGSVFVNLSTKTYVIELAESCIGQTGTK
jgi:dUTPase